VRTSSTDHEKYAIIGIGCRMPPSANSLEAFWKFLLRGGNALKPVRKDRWDPRQFFDEDQKRPGKMYAPKFAMLDADVKLFDPLAFGISPREAACMDPQQRLLLEVTWEAFEDAGIPLDKVAGSRTGVFIGGFCIDQLIHQIQPSNRYLIDSHSTVGASITILSNRLSHAFDLRGPSLTMDTACSSSLVAIHYACQSLMSGESDMVIAGGVNVMTRPDYPIMMSKGHFLADHGECHTFDVSASGYARGEGGGVFLIRRLRDAMENGDPIHAVIRGTGVNQDGHTDGISLPNSEAQESLARGVYERAGVLPHEVDYIEAHGTGTQAGDPAEARALNAVFSEGRKKKLPVGSVKTNIGHLEAAAGVAGVLKAIGAVKFRQIPRNLHFHNPNPKIPFEDYCLEVVGETTVLPSEEEKPGLLVGVNAFGYGGTNAHVIVESAPVARPATSETQACRPYLIPLSAQSEKALRDLTGKMAFLAAQGFGGSIQDLAFTAAFRRSHLDFRCVAMGGDLSQIREEWIAASTGEPHDGLVVGTAASGVSAGLVFVYTGMGPQWWGMGQELIRTEPVFAAVIDEIDGHFHKLSGWSLREAMIAGETESRMERTEVAQPANFAIQVALTRLWESFGIRPAAVVGHSVGEVVAAYVAGVYSLEEAVRVSFHRSRLQQTMAGRGAMLAVGLPEAEALKRIAGSRGVSIAAVNSFGAVTLSGDADELRAIAAGLEKEEIFQKFLRVEVAYHSPQMDPLREELLESLAGLRPREPLIPLYSTAYGMRVPAADWGADYWWQNVRQPVHFAAAIQCLFKDGYTHFLEVGPHPVLGNSIKECAVHLEAKATCFLSLRRKDPEQIGLLKTVAALYCAGFSPDWTALAPSGRNLLPLPHYPWQRESHWMESDRSKMERLGLPGPVYLNRTLPGSETTWEVEINRNYFPFLFDHGVQDQKVFAGMGYVEAALALCSQIHGSAPVILENVSFEKVLVVDYSKLQYLVTAFHADNGAFNISSRVEGEEDSIQRHCRGRMYPQTEVVAPLLDLPSLRSECPREVPVGDFYDRLERRGLFYGPMFRPTKEVLVGENCFFLTIDAAATLDSPSHPLHPTLFDAALQAVLFCSEGDRLFVPFSFDQFQYFSRPDVGECFASGRITSQSDSLIVADVWLTGSDGKVFAFARRISCQVIETGLEAVKPAMYYESAWVESDAEEAPHSQGGDILILCEEASAEAELARSLSVHFKNSALHLNGVASTEGYREILLKEPVRNRVVFFASGSPGVSGNEAADACSLSESALAFLQAAGAAGAGERDLTLVTRGAKGVEEEITNPAASAVAALGLVAQNEYPNIRCRSVDLPASRDSREAGWLAREILAGTTGETAIRGGRKFENVLRVVAENGAVAETTKKSLGEPVVLRLGTPGKSGSLFYEDDVRGEPGAGELEIRVEAVSLNYKDLLKVEGRLHPSATEDTFNGSAIGMECVGTILRCGPGSRFQTGDRVVSMLRDGFRSFAIVPEVFTIKIPGNLGPEVAGIPVVYLAAYRGLVDLARLKSGEKVLIHHGTGGLGLAAIDIARWAGAEIFATAGSEEKRQFLRDLGIVHVFSSRNLDFFRQIQEATDGGGVDVVIGAQTNQALHAGLGLLRSGGRYIEVGKKDISEDNGLPLRAFHRNLTFTSLDIDRLMKETPELVRETLEKIFARFASGDFHLPATKFFPASSIAEAFEEMARSRHLGKLLVDFSSGEVDVPRRVSNRPVVRPDGCYIVTGGTSGFGALSAVWLARQGAGKVVLVSRSGAKAPGVDRILEEIGAAGAKAEVLSVDVTDPAQVRELAAACHDGSYSLRGVLHAAMVLDDAMMEDMTPERFRKVFFPKVAGAWNFAQALELSETLDFLVFYSSVSAVVGNSGQTNYVAANSSLDNLAHVLRSRGLPAFSINWGALSESGVVARDGRLEAALAAGGITGLKNDQAFEAMDKIICGDRAQSGVFLVDWGRWREANPKIAEDRRFQGLGSGSNGDDGGGVAAAVRAELAGLPKEERLMALQGRLQDILAGTLKMSKEAVSLTRKLNEMGVDSLMVLELGLGIKEGLGVSFSAMEFLKGPNVEQLAMMAEKRLWK